MRILDTVGVSLVCLAAASAQIHTRTELVQGQPASFDFASMPANSVGVLLLSPAGVGAGLCFPPPFSACLGVLDPIILGPQLVTNAQGAADFGLVITADSQLFQIASQGLWLDLTQPSNPGIVVSNAVDGFIETLAAYNEPFDGDGIDTAWRAINPARFTHQLSGNAELELVPSVAGAAGSWIDDREGGMLAREVRGNFSIETTLRAVNPAQSTLPPSPDRRFGGLLLRDPSGTPGARNWAAIALGSGNATIPHAITAITTTGSASTFTLFDQSAEFDPLSAELRLVRVGDMVRCEYRNNPVVPFATLATVTLTGLPATVEAGMFVSSESSPPSVVAAFTDVRFAGQ